MKSYANLRRQEANLQVGEKLVNVEIDSRYIGSFEMLEEQVGNRAYQLALSMIVENMHYAIYILQLK